jgi:hypothetical protein
MNTGSVKRFAAQQTTVMAMSFAVGGRGAMPRLIRKWNRRALPFIEVFGPGDPRLEKPSESVNRGSKSFVDFG